MSLDPGRLRHRVELQQLVARLDTAGDELRGPQGESLRDWTTIATVWAAIDPLSAREFIESGSKQSQVVARITIRYRGDVDAAWRVKVGAKLYDIAGVLPDRESGLEYLTLPVSEGPGTGE